MLVLPTQQRHEPVERLPGVDAHKRLLPRIAEIDAQTEPDEEPNREVPEGAASMETGATLSA